MSSRWKVNEGTQVNHGGKLHEAGDTFTATEEELAGLGVLGYVSKVGEPQTGESQPAAENKAQAAPKPGDAKAK